MHANVAAIKMELLTKSAWNYKDIINYFSTVNSAPTAIAIKNRAIKEFDGAVKYGSEYASVESVLNLFGTNREYEINAMRKLLNNSEVIIAKYVIDFSSAEN